jgi:plastocyanin
MQQQRTPIVPWFLLVFWVLSSGLHAETPPQPVEIKITVLSGLKFDLTRFVVPPGAPVTIKFQNPDQMIHNFVITEPGARAEVVTAALALGADGPAKNFIPDSKKILWHTKALNPGEHTELSFTAPTREGVYPYVCTSMGHGFIMYGAMYVSTKALPPLASDPNVPPALVAVNDASDYSHTTLDHIVVSRTFLPDCSPAAIAVGLPGGQSYCFDAGLCRLRYAWKGGFVDNSAHWIGKGDSMGQVVGRIYYRAQPGAPIRIGDRSREPVTKWLGYEMVKGVPHFHYRLDQAEVTEWPEPLRGESGVVFHYEIDSHGAPVSLVTDPDGGATFGSSASGWKDGHLSLTAEQAKSFTVTLTERPGQEPLRYWSMNDLVFTNHTDPRPGVVGRAFTPGGTDGKKPQRLGAGIMTEALKHGATLMAWVKLDPPKTDKKSKAANPTGLQPIFSSGDENEGLLILAPEGDEQWHHVAVTLDGNGGYAIYVDAQPRGGSVPGEQLTTGKRSGLVRLPSVDSEISIGSIGDQIFLNGLLDELRIFDRVLPSEEIAKSYHHESAILAAAK